MKRPTRRRPSYIPEKGDLIRLPTWVEGKVYEVMKVEGDEMLAKNDRGRQVALTIDDNDWHKVEHIREIQAEIWGTVHNRKFQPFDGEGAARSAAAMWPGHFLACLSHGMLIDVEKNEPFDIFIK